MASEYRLEASFVRKIEKLTTGQPKNSCSNELITKKGSKISYLVKFEPIGHYFTMCKIADKRKFENTTQNAPKQQISVVWLQIVTKQISWSRKHHWVPGFP
jgi:hypothetical protein